MAVPATTLNIDIADYKAVIEQWTTVLDRAHSWETPQRVTVYRRSLAPSPEIEHDMIRLGDIKLNESNGRSADRDLEVQILIDFFRKLPSLSELEWRIDTLLMPPLLEFLRDELPGCNLHLMPFKIGHDAEPSYIQSILSLPGLQTIWFRRNFYGCEEEIVQHMARASNGNVREVRIYWSSPGASPFGEPLPPMWEQKHAAPDGQRLGQVQSLQLSGMSGEHESNLEIWARHTDLSHLRTLSLESLVTAAALETMNNLSLRSLHSLGIHIDWRDKSDLYNATLQKFICNLPALSHLRLTGDLQPRALEAILDHLDPTLHTLYLIPGKTAFDSSTIALVTDRCKHVQELGITMKRAWNKPGEDIAVLKALGRMPQLSHLDLTFDASDPTLLFTDKTDKSAVTRLAQSDPSFSAFDREMFSKNGFGLKEVRNGHIRDAFVNSAIDADLARAVFNTILSGTPDGGRLLLQRLSLKSTGGGYFNTGSHAANITNFAEELGREWVVERSDYDDALEVHRVEVEDIWVEPPYVWSDASSDEDVPRLPGGVEDIFRRIWPGNGDWTEEWHSFPLLQ